MLLSVSQIVGDPLAQLVKDFSLTPLEPKLILYYAVNGLSTPFHAKTFQSECATQCTNAKTINCFWCVVYLYFIHAFNYDRFSGFVKSFLLLRR